MANTEDMPQWMARHLVLYAARSAHEFCAMRIRQKLAYSTSTNELLAEADEMVRRDIGWFPSEGPADPYADAQEEQELEQSMREIAARNFEALTEAESYMWGLGIAGLVHQWERDTRGAIEALLVNPPAPKKLHAMDFKALCKEVHKTGFGIDSCPSFAHLRTASLIASTIKHGKGKAFTSLVMEKPELFQGGPVGVRMENLPREPQHLRVWQAHFDEAATAISEIWSSYEDAIIRAARKQEQN